jgi:hypothetical protein
MEGGKKKYEYNHYDLGYGLHYGVHSRFGEHVALGQGRNMVHIYPYKIYIGDDHSQAINLTPDQQAVVQSMLSTMLRRASVVKPETTEGELEDGAT